MTDDLDKLESPPPKGHNRVRVAGIDSDALKGVIERWENLQDEIDDAREGQKSILKEAKVSGLFDMAAVRRVLRIRRKPIAEYKKQLEDTENYLLALGLL